jgi:hypothetical protein
LQYISLTYSKIKQLKYLFILSFFLGVVRPQLEPFLSKEYNFSINFPNEVDLEKSGNSARVFSSYEVLDSSFILYQVQIMDEQPGAPLIFSKEVEYNDFLIKFLVG